MYKAAGKILNKSIAQRGFGHLASAQQFELFGWYFKYAILPN